MTGFRMTPNTTPVLQADAEPHNGAAGLPHHAQGGQHGDQSSAGPPEQELRAGQSKDLLVWGEGGFGMCLGDRGEPAMKKQQFLFLCNGLVNKSLVEGLDFCRVVKGGFNRDCC